MRIFKIFLCAVLMLSVALGLCACGSGGSPIGTCTMTIDCSKALENADLLPEGVLERLPADGIIYASTEVPVYEGDAVDDIFIREMKKAKIHFQLDTAVDGSNYAQGINNLYEFDAGPLSGWLFAINGEIRSVSCSSVKVQPGDVIRWYYTCQLGQDITPEP